MCVIHTASLYLSLRWRHNGRDSVSNHQPHDCLLNRLFRRRSKKTRKLRVAGLCAGNSPGTGEFPAQMASNAENVSIWWRHHGVVFKHTSSMLRYMIHQFDILVISFKMTYMIFCEISSTSDVECSFCLYVVIIHSPQSRCYVTFAWHRSFIGFWNRASSSYRHVGIDWLGTLPVRIHVFNILYVANSISSLSNRYINSHPKATVHYTVPNWIPRRQ